MQPLEHYLDEQLGGREHVTVTPMPGGGSCEIFAVDRGDDRWVLRRAPRHASSSTAHDVLREFRILDAIKDEPVRIARPVLCCDDPDVFGAPFYVMERIDGAADPQGRSLWRGRPAHRRTARRSKQLVDALVEIHAVDWQRCGLDRFRAYGAVPGAPGRRAGSRSSTPTAAVTCPTARRIGDWLDAHRPADQPAALCHGDYKLDNVLFAPDAPPRLLAVVDWEMAAIGDPLVDLAWALIFHPGPEGTMPLGMAEEPPFALEHLPDRAALVERYADRSGRDVADLGWYDVFSRWKLAIVLEGSYAKFQQGLSDKPIHEFFGSQADLLLDQRRRPDRSED